MIWYASPGKGRWADSPWIAMFDPLVTTTTQKGYYPAYLFTSSLDGVYLFLNQGMEQQKNEFGVRHAREILQHRSQLIRSRLKDYYENIFSVAPIDLQHHGPSTRLALYEPGHVFGTKYLRDNLPSSTDLYNELEYMIELYLRATVLGGTTELDDNTLENEDQDNIKLNFDEKRKYRFHKTFERNQTLSKRAKEAHGYVCQVCGFDFKSITEIWEKTSSKLITKSPFLKFRQMEK